MKTYRLYFLLLSVLLNGTNPLLAQWVQTNGPYGGSVNCFASIGTNVFAGTENGVFLSTNNGRNWTAATWD